MIYQNPIAFMDFAAAIYGREEIFMSERFVDEDVKTRLILSGMVEIEEHGVRDFSLRRAALIAGVSCAAPYRYFESKEAYIASVFSYLASKWRLMIYEIKSAVDDGRRMLCELSMASVRFWVANKNLYSALLISKAEGAGVSILDFDEEMYKIAYDYFLDKLGRENKEQSAEGAEEKATAVRSFIYGYITLIAAGGIDNSKETMQMIERQIYSLI